MSALKVITTNSSPALITTVYYGKNALSPSKLTCPTCPTEFTDGTNSANGGGCGYCQSTGANSSRLADEIFLEEYFRSTSSFSDPLKGIPFNEDAFRASNTLDQTNIKPIFSAESKLYGANDNFFGEWMLKMTNGDNQLRNIFVAENEHYAVWAPLRAPTSNENILAPGAYNWFTSSYLLRSFKNPPLFYTNAPICSTQTNSPLHVNYIGPREKNIQYHLRLTDVSNNIVNITSGYTPDFSLDQTTDFLADATSTLTVNGTNAPYTLTLELDYGNGTPVATYSEVIQVNSTLTITPIGYSTLNNISICDNKQVLLKASKFSNIDWYKDGIKVAQGSSSGEQYFNASESGSYYAIRTSGSTCLGQSNTVNLVGFDQSVFISPVCSTAAILKLNANYTSNVFNLGNLQYKWNTGETSQLIVIGTASDSRTFSVEISNSFDNCVAFDGITIPSGSFNSTSPTISASNLICNAGYGSVQLSVTGTEYPKTIVSDGVVNRFITWYGDPILPQTLTLLPPGHYQVTVTNNGNSCNDNTTFDIGTAVDFQNTANPSFTNVTCNGGSNGTAIFSALNTSLNLTFEWIGVPENSITKTNSSTTANNLPAGVYSLKIVETGTCNFQYINFTISQPTGFTSSATSNIIQCNGSATGAINQTVIPTPVSFSWSNSPVTEDISGLVAGTYSCTVTSSTGCSQTFQYNVDQNPAPTLTETHINVCIGGSNGSATVTAVNGMSPYTYLWLPSGGNAATANNLAAGSYSCRVTDVNGCQKNISVIISSSGTATVSAGPDQTVCGTTTTLAGSNPSPGSGTWSISVGAGGSFSNMNDPAATFSGTPGTIYTLKWTVVNPACASNTFDEVSIGFKISPSTSNAGIDQSVCGISANLSANSPSSGTGSWSIIGGGMGGNINNPSNPTSNFTGTNGSTYTLRWTISNAPCIESFDEVSITLNPIPTVNVSAQNQSCPGVNDGAATANPSPLGAYQYLWSCTTATTPTVSGLAPGTCNVTVTNMSTSCVSAQATFTIVAAIPLCPAMYHTCAVPRNVSSQFGTGFIGTSGNRATVAIHSDFTINNNFEFRFADVAIDPNVKIIVAANCTLTIQSGSHLFGCTNMWDGIYLSSSTSQLIINGSTIEDAMQAVFSSSAARFVVSGSIFDRNLVSIHAENGSYSTSSVTGTSFRCTGSTLKPPYGSQRSSNHIELNNVSTITIGGGAINNFENSNIGIFSTDSYLNLSYNIFSNHTNCIRSINANLNSLNRLYATQNTFSNSSYGVYMQGGDLSTVISNTFQTTRTGIMTRECVNRAYINCVSNQMSDVTMGIYLLQNVGAIMDVSDNAIVTLQDSRAGGIKVVESTNFSSNGAFVSKNNIETYGNFGVWYQNNSKGGINNNSVKLKPLTSFLNPNRYCVRVENCRAETIDCNGLEGENTSLLNVPSYGLSLTYTPENLIDCNSSSRTRTAMEFIGDCDKSTIQGNTYNYHKFGLYVGADATAQQGVIGDQALNQNSETRGNRYQGFNNSGNFPTGYALYRYHPQLLPPFQAFWVCGNSGIDIYSPQSSGANILGNQISPTFHSEPPYKCPSYCQNMVQPIVEEEGEIKDKEDLVEGNGGFADLDEVLRYSLEKELFEKLHENIALLDSSTVLEMFFYLNSQANLGKLTEVEENLRSLMDSIVYSDSTLKEQRILQAKMQNESVVTSNLIEQNMKIVNSVKLETIAKGIFSFSETQQEQITQVAFQCPYIGGKSVYDARGLYALIDEEYFFDDDGICNSTGSQRLANPRIKDNDQIRVYPIPTRSIATIEYILDESKEYSLSITDALGRIVYINTINGSVNSKEIDMSLWRDGIYYYHITDNESEFYNGKISLVK